MELIFFRKIIYPLAVIIMFFIARYHYNKSKFTMSVYPILLSLLYYNMFIDIKFDNIDKIIVFAIPSILFIINLITKFNEIKGDEKFTMEVIKEIFLLIIFIISLYLIYIRFC